MGPLFIGFYMTEDTKIIVSRPLRHSEVTPSGNYYPREVLEKMVQEWKAKNTPMFGTEDSGDNPPNMVDLTKVVTVVEDMYVDDEGLVVHQRILNTPKGGVMLTLLNSIENSAVDAVIAPRLSIVKEGAIVLKAVLYGFEFSKWNLVALPVKE